MYGSLYFFNGFCSVFSWSVPDPFDTFFIHFLLATGSFVAEKGPTLAFYAYPTGLG